jgi:hypothetical protein
MMFWFGFYVNKYIDVCFCFVGYIYFVEIMGCIFFNDIIEED